MILVTGGAGFVGANLCRSLLKDGFEVRVLDDFSAGTSKYLDDLGRHVDIRRGSVTDSDAVARALKGVTSVVHLAAESGVPQSVAEPSRDFTVNVAGTFTVTNAARLAGAERVVFASSGAVVAGAEPPLTEDMLPKPLSPYGVSKLYGEALLQAFETTYGIVGVSLRFANVYGPYSLHKTSVVASLIRAALHGGPLTVDGNGTQTRDLVYVEDIVGAVMRALYVSSGGLYHLGTGVETSVNRVAEIVKEVTEPALEVVHGPARPNDPVRNFSDASAARDNLGWLPNVSLSDGVARTAAWLASADPESEGGSAAERMQRMRHSRG